MLRVIGSCASNIRAYSRSNKTIYRLYLVAAGYTFIIAALGRGALGIFHLDPYYTPLEPINNQLTANLINSIPLYGLIISLLLFPFCMHFLMTQFSRKENYEMHFWEWAKYAGTTWTLYLAFMVANAISIQYKSHVDSFHQHYLNGRYGLFIETVNQMYGDPRDANYVISQLNYTKAENKEAARSILAAQQYVKENLKSYTLNDRYSSYVLLAFSTRNLKEQQNQDDLLKLKNFFIAGLLFLILCAFLLQKNMAPPKE